jgi:hypothetical protein
MRSIFLTVVVVCALALAGIGGVFANYQDIEVSYDNYLETGDLDLKVSYPSGAQAVWYDTPVPVIIDGDNFMPECQDKSFHFDLHNAGEYEQGTGYVYLHFKNLEFVDTGKTEPELVAEEGGVIGEKADGTIVTLPAGDALGVDWGTGDGGELANHLRVVIFTSPTGTGDWTEIDLSAYDTDPQNGEVKLNEVVCSQIPLGELDSGASMWVWVSLMLQDIDEDDLGYSFFDATIAAERKWEDWPTNALQNDKVMFDMSFELFQFPVGAVNDVP